MYPIIHKLAWEREMEIRREAERMAKIREATPCEKAPMAAQSPVFQTILHWLQTKQGSCREC